MTPRDIELAHDGYRKRKEEEWEMIRTQAYWSAMPHFTKEAGFKPSSIVLPIDKPKTIDDIKLVKIRKLHG